MIRVGHPITWRLVVRFPLSPLKGWWTDSWKGYSPPSCHGRGALEQGTVPPCYPGAVIGCPAPVNGICLHECVTVCMCMCVFNRCQPGWVKCGGEILCISLHDNNSDLNLNCSETPIYLFFFMQGNAHLQKRDIQLYSLLWWFVMLLSLIFGMSVRLTYPTFFFVVSILSFWWPSVDCKAENVTQIHSILLCTAPLNSSLGF